MGQKFSEQLAAYVERGDEASVGPIPVIVTLNEFAYRESRVTSACERAGLKVECKFDLIPAVAGTILSSDLPRLEDVSDVEYIDLDSEVRAV